MSSQTVLPIDRNSVADLSKSRNEPSWMTELRLNALELAGSLELPKLEKTRIDRWNLDSYGTYKTPAPLQKLEQLPEAAKRLLGEDAAPVNLIVQRDSGVVWKHVDEELAKQGVIFTDLETAVREHGELVQKHFMTAVKADENRLTALHAALWNGGVFLYVPRNVEVKMPLQAIFLSDDPSATFAPHVLVVAESNSSVVYVDNYLSDDGKEFVHNGIVEVIAKPGSRVQFATVNNLGKGSTGLTYRRAVLDNDARVEWIVGELNSGNAMADTSTQHRGNGSSSDAKVISVGRADQKLNLTTRANHFGKNTPSDMITRAVMKDEATAIINGITKIEKGATGANGQQTERVLMLSPKARGDANPILLIDEDDVKAGHAASVGQVNPEHMYYLMSRGISKADAHKLVVYGFLAPVINEIPLENVQKQLQTLVEGKLGQ
ncbi:Fe-S cluster assembly protein SufD [Paenibacillus flagellatus]|uniref:Fe-S cluster assembly protein SufD n=1 Tax=Paenibacillus flagellatus TaxID=2211139 RepID=A0A2V5KP49_9BACL|nr:Fe-S cluster assembly protein SufD [Paenibacillus flagellatus]PYI57180.1 Fe-S cluster assembly protein SufD [Paenibacillus flagellatus]